MSDPIEIGDEDRPLPPTPANVDFEWDDEDEGLCACRAGSWEMCDCGQFFLEWVCGYDPSAGLCSLAGSEDCDWECPRGGLG